MADDPKKTLKDLLDDITLKKDDGETAASLIFLYEGGPETLDSLLNAYDMVATIGDGAVRPERRMHEVPTHYPGAYAVKIQTVDKYSEGALVCTAEKMVWKMTEQVRGAIEANAETATYRLTIAEERPHDRRLGGLDVKGAVIMVQYKDV